MARDASNRIFHARNLDFGLLFGWDKANETWTLTEKLRPLLFNARIVKGGQTLYVRGFGVVAIPATGSLPSSSSSPPFANALCVIFLCVSMCMQNGTYCAGFVGALTGTCAVGTARALVPHANRMTLLLGGHSHEDRRL